MEDNYIIDLFWSRDESAIQLVDKSNNLPKIGETANRSDSVAVSHFRY